MIEFEYNKNEINIHNKFYKPENPFIVCKGDICQDNVIYYNFTEGNSYKIYVKIQTIICPSNETHYIVPAFEFPKRKDSDKNKGVYINNQFNFMFLILLLFFMI